MKKLFKPFSYLFFSFIFIALTGCSSPYYNHGEFDIFHPYKTLQDYVSNQPSEQLEWISKRTLSLRFGVVDQKENKYQYKFGTGWILSKANEDKNDFKYYIATNIHVANILNPLSATTRRYEQTNNKKIVLTDNYSLKNVSINFSTPNPYSFIKDKNNDLIILEDKTYITFTSTEKINIVYSAIGNNIVDNATINGSNNSFVNPYKNKIVKNPAIDFAVFELDFKSILYKKNFQGYSVSNFLKAYNLEPTKFANNLSFDLNENYYLAGYVQDNELIKKQTWPTWFGLSNVKFNINNLYQGLAYKNDLEDIKYENEDDYLLIKPANGIDYVTKNNDKFITWYQNVASQVLIEGGNIGGGASGSVVINSKKEVVGIYWGVYSHISNQGFDYSYGAIDLLSSNNYEFVIEKQGLELVYKFPSYNIADKLKNNNLLK